MKIGELAQRAGVAASAIRYYEQLGLLPKPVRGVNGYRVYSDSALERLHLIQIGQNLGFSLQAIQRVLALQGSAYEDGLIRGVDERLAEIELMMATLNEQRNLVDDPADLIGVRRCRAVPNQGRKTGRRIAGPAGKA